MESTTTQPAMESGLDQSVESASDRSPTGLAFAAARSLPQVLEAWALVYTSYRRKGLILPNKYHFHTTRPAVGEQSMVVAGRIGPLLVSTLTAILDGPQGLPLDRVYRDQLDGLRGRGRKMLEVSLFADRRECLARSSAALLQLMRFVWHWGMAAGVTDFVIGVHPRHARFYSRAFGFEQVGEEKTYAAVNHHPVVMLSGAPAVQLARNPMPRGLEYFSQNPVPAEEFSPRYLFPADELAQSPLPAFLADQAGGRLHVPDQACNDCAA